MRPSSLRSRLLSLLLGSSALLSLAGAITVDRLVESRVASSFDEALVAKAQVFMTLTILWPDQSIEFEFADEFMPEFTDPENPAFFQVQLGDGRLIELSESFLFDGVPEGARLALQAEPADRPRLVNTVMPDGRRGRQVQVDFRPQLADEDEEEAEQAEADGSPGWRADEGSMGGGPGSDSDRPVVSIAIAVERASLDHRLVMLRLAMLAVTAGFLLCLALLAVLSLELGLWPVHRLARDVEALDERNLDTRLEVGALPRELRPIGEQLNALLDRIGHALQRERQLTSDIAHDLKTPVAELRALCDVGARWPDDKEATARFFEDARDVARTLERTIEQLLALARHDAGRERVQRAPFDFTELVRVTSSAFRADARRRGLELHLELAESIRVDSDRDKVGNVVGNLVGNAVAHSLQDTVITCEAARVGDSVELRITNQASGLEDEDLPRLFERFWRKDGARGGGSHAGLGLALAKADAELLGASLSAELDPGRFTAILVLPGVMSEKVAAAAGRAP